MKYSVAIPFRACIPYPGILAPRHKGMAALNIVEGEWKFYRETGLLWQIGNFKNNIKHGRFVRYDKDNQVENDETFENGKVISKK